METGKLFLQVAILQLLMFCCYYQVQCESKKSHLKFSDIFPQTVGNFSPNFTRLLHVPIYAELQIFIQLFATLTKLCHIKRQHHGIMCSKCPLSTETQAGWSHLIWHKLVIVGDK